MEITVITAAYNGGSFIRHTAESLQAQTHTKWRLIVFDDGSKDNTRDIIKELAQKDERIKLLCHPENKNLGLAQTLKKAAACVKTDYVCFLEHDDLFDKDTLKNRIAFLNKHPKAEIIFNSVKCFGDEQRVKKLSIFNKAAALWVKILNPFTCAYNLNFAFLGFNAIPAFSCVMLKTSLLENADFICPTPQKTDYWLWAQLSFKHKFYFIDEPLTLWRLTKTSYTMRCLGNKAADKEFKTALKSLYKSNLSAPLYYLKVCTSAVLCGLFNCGALIIKPLAKLFLGIK